MFSRPREKRPPRRRHRHAKQCTQGGPGAGPLSDRGRENRGRLHNHLGEAPEARAEVSGVRQALRRLRPAGDAPLARDRPRRLPMLPRVRAPAREVPRARREGRGGALGALGGEQVRLGLRGPGRVARAPHARERARRARARGLAHRGRHLPGGRGVARGGGRARTPRRAQARRDRRDQLQEGPQARDGRRRPRPGARTSLRRGGTGRRRRTPSSTCPRRSRGKASRSPPPTAPGGPPTSSPSGSPTPSSPWTRSTS